MAYSRPSRRKLAEYVAGKLMRGDETRKVFKELAAYLIDAKRTRDIDLLVDDIEDVLAGHGIVVADVVSAHPLTDTIRKEIRSLIDAPDIRLRETIDTSVLGGIRVVIPGKRFDGTIRRKLTALKAKQL